MTHWLISEGQFEGCPVVLCRPQLTRAQGQRGRHLGGGRESQGGHVVNLGDLAALGYLGVSSADNCQEAKWLILLHLLWLEYLFPAKLALKFNCVVPVQRGVRSWAAIVPS